MLAWSGLEAAMTDFDADITAYLATRKRGRIRRLLLALTLLVVVGGSLGISVLVGAARAEAKITELQPLRSSDWDAYLASLVVLATDKTQPQAVRSRAHDAIGSEFRQNYFGIIGSMSANGSVAEPCARVLTVMELYPADAEWTRMKGDVTDLCVRSERLRRQSRRLGL